MQRLDNSYRVRLRAVRRTPWQGLRWVTLSRPEWGAFELLALPPASRVLLRERVGRDFLVHVEGARDEAGVVGWVLGATLCPFPRALRIRLAMPRAGQAAARTKETP